MLLFVANDSGGGSSEGPVEAIRPNRPHRKDSWQGSVNWRQERAPGRGSSQNSIYTPPSYLHTPVQRLAEREMSDRLRWGRDKFRLDPLHP